MTLFSGVLKVPSIFAKHSPFSNFLSLWETLNVVLSDDTEDVFIDFDTTFSEPLSSDCAPGSSPVLPPTSIENPIAQLQPTVDATVSDVVDTVDNTLDNAV